MSTAPEKASRHKRVAFLLSPANEQLIAGSVVDYWVPLSAEAALSCRSLHLNVLDIFEGMTLEEVRELNSVIGHNWQEFLLHQALDTLQDYEYFNMLFQSNIQLARWATQRVLLQSDVAVVLVPNPDDLRPFKPGVNPETVRWLIALAICHECQTRDAKYEEQISHASLRHPSTARVRLAILGAQARDFKLRMRRRILKLRQAKWPSRVNGHPAGRPDVLLIVQPSKIGALRQELEGAFDFQILPLSELTAHTNRTVSLPRQASSATGDYGRSPEQEANAILAGVAFNEYAYIQEVKEEYPLKSSIILTDAVHEPVVRQCLRSAIRHGCSTATVPEGANAVLGTAKEFSASLSIDPIPAMRFTVEEESQMPGVNDSSTLREGFQDVGYLAQDECPGPSFMRVFAPLAEATKFLKLVGAKFKSKPIVLFDIGGLSEWPLVARLVNVPQSTQVLQMLQIVEYLCANDVTVIAKGRDRQLTHQFSALGGGRPVVFGATRWSCLAQFCDVTITRDSSIAWQSLSQGIPTLIWNFSDVPSRAETTLRAVDEPWVFRASTLVEMLAGVTRVRMSRSLRADPPVEVRPQRIVQWIEAQQASGAHPDGQRTGDDMQPGR